MDSIAQHHAAARDEWAAGWPVVLSAMAGISTPAAMVYTVGLFMIPLQQEFGWSRTEVTVGLTINAVVHLICSPFIGIAIDRLGSRRIGITGIILFLSAFAAQSTANGNLLHWWGMWLAIALTSMLISPAVWATAVVSRFETARGLATSVTLCGTGIASILAPVVCGALIESVGWRLAFLCLAAGWALLTLPLLVMFFYGATDLRRLNRSTAAETAQSARLPGLEVRDAILSARFFKLAISVSLTVMVVTATIVHFIPLLRAKGQTPQQIAAIASAIGFASITGRLACGTLLDRFSGSLIGAIIFSLPLVAFAILLKTDVSGTDAIIVAIVIGLAVGAEFEIGAYLVARHFGMYRYATLFAIIAALLGLATGLGPLLASVVYDRFGSYDYALWGAICISVVSTILIATMGPYPRELEEVAQLR
ncbi:MFS transporter [Rhizorhabdus argentea]|uniref:MFS transporter n=1 Tax=Rhizorhabdus argentea TaxID=1387174 RepID=UPI0030EEF6B0